MKISSLISSLKSVLLDLTDIQEENAEEEKMTLLDKGIRILQTLDDETEAIAAAKALVQCDTAAEYPCEWIYLSSGRLPKPLENVLFSTTAGSVYEGFLETTDTSRPYLNQAGKIAFPDYEDGGRWYRYHFRDLLEMRHVVAWMPKPAAASVPEKKH